jgi:hypothetical protein
MICNPLFLVAGKTFRRLVANRDVEGKPKKGQERKEKEQIAKCHDICRR